MSRILRHPLPGLRRLLVALIAVGLVLRLAGGCEGMAARPEMSTAHVGHCADMPARPAKAPNVEGSTCAWCAALPARMEQRPVGAPILSIVQPPALSASLTSLSSGPAPPPPRAI